MALPLFPCEHDPHRRRTRRKYRLECSVCGSFGDRQFHDAPFEYSEAYPSQRGHFDPRVGALKIRSMRAWLRSAGISLERKIVCDVGFGGGFCLKYLQDHSKAAYGIEVNDADFKQAQTLGISASHLLDFRNLPTHLNEKIDVWLFQDSFEHLPSPADFMAWVLANSSPHAQLLMVAPMARSMSDLLLGPYWPHRVPDHVFHWSKRGLVDFMEKRSFVLQNSFFPIKYISLAMIYSHAAHKLGRKQTHSVDFLNRLNIPLNFGEMGLLFQRKTTEASQS